jgi:hemerythrin superfamily protein
MKDHREVEQMFARYERLGERAMKTKRTIVRDVIEELSKHAAVEEQVLYPEMKRSAPGGEGLAEEGLKEHGEVKRLLADLDKMSPEDDDYEDKMMRLMQSVRHHVQEEEDEMFPKLRSEVDAERLIELGKMVETAKMMAPTRPHPHAPTTPPANVVVGAVAGVADRVRDAGRKLLDR